MRGFLLGLMVLLLAGCGFHLRGSGANAGFAYPSAFVIGNGGTAQQLKTLLTEFPNVTLLTAATPESVQITIIQEGSSQQVLTLTSAGRVSEYRLFYTVAFKARRGDETLISDGKISLYRDYTYDDNNVLGKTNEADTLIANMQQDAALQVLRRINTTARNLARKASETAAASVPAATSPLNAP